jgi:predicted nuclease of predicted toxin-antitoxin system
MHTEGIRLILDQGLPRDAASLLRETGWQCEHVGELGMSSAEDTDILSVARGRGAVLITLDADFHALLAVSMAAGPSVVRLRMQGLDGQKVAAHIIEAVKRFGTELREGCMVTVKERKTTYRMLPVANS